MKRFAIFSALREVKKELEAKKSIIEQELQRFATKDEKLKGDWDTRFPKLNGDSGSQALEEAADEVEEYATKLPIEHSLETRLKDIDLALEKIGKGTYGRCEKCDEKISKDRLEAYPEARFCLDCAR
jgi:DnaK suppressor protein